MAGGSGDEVRAHIEAIAVRSPRELRQLTDRLRRGTWPAAGDHTQPAARQWLRLWKASGPVPAPTPCGCASGHCLVCN